MRGMRLMFLTALLAGSLSTVCGCVGATASKGADMPEVSPVFDVPRMSGIVVDGNGSDWGAKGFRVDVMASESGAVQDPERFDARFRLGWDHRGLLVLVSLTDQDHAEGDTLEDLWRKDCVEFFMLDKRGGTELVQAVVAAGMDPNHPDLRHELYDRRKSETLKKTKPQIVAARVRGENSYTMEVLLPWENVGIAPRVGAELGFQMYADNYVEGGSQFSAIWYPISNPMRDPKNVHCIRLAEKASPPVLSSVRVRYDGANSTKITMVGSPEIAGKTLSAFADGKEVARGALIQTAGRSSVNLSGPFPPFGIAWNSLEIKLDGQTVDTVAMPDANKARTDATLGLPFVFSPFCFTGNRFPTGGFENPAEAVNVIGPHAVNITYYDAQCNVVTVADKPGRYSAMVEITPSEGPAIKRFYTLFRAAGRLRDVDFTESEPPKQPESADAPFARGRPETPAEYVKHLVTSELANSEYGAILLAWRQETEPGTAITDYTKPESFNARWKQELKRKTDNAVSLQYFVHLPGGMDKAQDKKWPMLLFLHGGGWPIEDLPENPVVGYANAHPGFPFIVVAPYCPRNTNWSSITPELGALVDEVSAKYPVDQDRIYVAGLSMGGMGTWRLAVEYPERFAAVVPICGGGDARDVARIKDLPTWVFHATNDQIVPIKRSEDMVQALEKVNGRVKFTIDETEGHSVWRKVFEMDEVYSWMLEQARGKPAEAKHGTTENAAE